MVPRKDSWRKEQDAVKLRLHVVLAFETVRGLRRRLLFPTNRPLLTSRAALPTEDSLSWRCRTTERLFFVADSSTMELKRFNGR